MSANDRARVLFAGKDPPEDAPDVAFEAVDQSAVIERLEGGAYDCLVVASDSDEARSLLAAVEERWPALPRLMYATVETAEAVERAYDAADTVVRRGQSEDERVLVCRVRELVGREREGWASEHLQSLARTASDGILTIDGDSVIRFANPVVASMFGYEREDLLDQPLTTLMDERSAERHLAGLERYLETGERALDWSGIELTGRRRDGTTLPIRVSFSEFTHRGRQFFTGIVRDVSERRERERELRRYETILQTMSDGVYVLDDEGRFVTVNDRYVELLGYSRDHLVGTPAVRIFDEEITARVDAIQESFEAVDDVATVETTIETAGGEPLPIEARISPYPLDDGDYGRVGVVRDLRERERLESELGEIFERVTDAFFALDTEWRFTYVNDRAEELLDRTGTELLGKVVWEEFSEAAGTTFQAEYERAMETQEPVAFEEYYPPLETWFAVSAYPSETGLSVYFRDVADRRRREETIRALSDGARALMDAGTREAVCDIGAETAREVVDLPNPVIALYDEESGRLRPTEDTREAAERIGPPLFDPDGDDLTWRAFVGGERHVYDSLSTAVESDSHSGSDGDPETGTDQGDDRRPTPPSMQSALLYPLGRHGVLLAAAPEPEAFDDLDVSLAGTLAANVQSALDRADREETIRERSDALEQRNRALERLERVNEVIREITQVLTAASTREEIETAICDRLVDVDPYRFAWIGTRDAAGSEMLPRTAAGEGFEGDLALPIDEGSDAPTVRALLDRETTVAADIRADPPMDPWRAGALRKGYRSLAAVPLLYRESLYGVLTIYAGTDDAFEPMERAVLSELGETIGYALNGLERKRALVGEGSVELDFRVRDHDDPLLALVTAAECDLAFEHVIQRTDGTLRVFFSTEGADADRIAELGEAQLDLGSIRSISDRGNSEALFECTLSETAFLTDLLDRGGVPRSLAVRDGDGRIVVRVPRAGDVRSFIELFEHSYGDVELVARRERDEPVWTDEEFRSEFERALTDRQEEVLRTAYYAGFFDWPREHTGQDIADMLGVSQPTVNRHMREGERKLFSLLFEE